MEAHAVMTLGKKYYYSNRKAKISTCISTFKISLDCKHSQLQKTNTSTVQKKKNLLVQVTNIYNSSNKFSPLSKEVNTGHIQHHCIHSSLAPQSYEQWPSLQLCPRALQTSYGTGVQTFSLPELH